MNHEYVNDDGHRIQLEIDEENSSALTITGYVNMTAVKRREKVIHDLVNHIKRMGFKNKRLDRIASEAVSLVWPGLQETADD